ncbi:hypothetical protein K1T71_011108 [Dendrolimus kikuchii]|uniref:Uncharacterized protein n=1 Tax=Dendrolimus kikuchii TaxID=765133 RepID=A0ACC1CN83_9NEOP|nr:hypothetical protein K1T71_011108 [Dendrolimus kikuchii]
MLWLEEKNSPNMLLAGVKTNKVEGEVCADPVEVSKPEEHKMSCVVGGAHAFVLRISSLVGLAPLRFESRKSGFNVSLSSPMCIYSFILITILVSTTIFGLVSEINVGTKMAIRMSSRTSQVVSTCDVLVVVVTAGTGVYGAPRRMKKMLKLMEDVASVDNSIGVYYSKITERKLCALLLAIMIFFTALITDDFCFYVIQAKRLDRQWEVVINYIGFYLLWYIVMILELQFAFTALSVRARFQVVNNALAITARRVSLPMDKPKATLPVNVYAIRVAPVDSQMFANVSLLVESKSSEESPVILLNTVNGEPRLLVTPCEAIRRLAALYGTLCEVVNRVDESYGLPLVVILLSTMLHLVVTPYFLIMELIVSTNRVHFLVLQFLWCATHLLRMFIIVEPCHYTIAEGKRAERLVCKLMTSVPSTGVLPSRLKLFSRQLMLRSAVYTPLGMCTLDRPLVASVIGAVTTYLVILIQFQKYDN